MQVCMVRTRGRYRLHMRKVFTHITHTFEGLPSYSPREPPMSHEREENTHNITQGTRAPLESRLRLHPCAEMCAHVYLNGSPTHYGSVQPEEVCKTQEPRGPRACGRCLAGVPGGAHTQDSRPPSGRRGSFIQARGGVLGGNPAVCYTVHTVL